MPTPSPSPPSEKVDREPALRHSVWDGHAAAELQGSDSCSGAAGTDGGSADAASPERGSGQVSSPGSALQEDGSEGHGSEQEGGPGGGKVYRDEEDALVEYLYRQKRIGQHSLGPGPSDEMHSPASHSETGTSSRGEGSMSSPGQSAAAPPGGPDSLEDINAGTQRLLRERATGDRIGKYQGPPQESKSIAEVLAKMRKDAGLAGCSARGGSQNRADSHGGKAQTRKEAAENGLELLGEVKKAPDAPEDLRKTVRDWLAEGIQLADTADLEELLVVSQDASQASLPEVDLNVRGPAVPDNRDSAFEHSRGTAVEQGGAASPSQGGEERAQDAAALSVPCGSSEDVPAEGDIDSCPDGKEGREDEREGSTDDEYGESRSDAGSGDSTFEDSGMEEDEDSPEARERAYEEARAMLRDQGGRRRDQFLEEEAEMSEDEGHSDDSGSDQEDDEAEQEALLRDLIGHEKDRKGDEQRRARLHAEWQVAEDERNLRRLMDGVQNGFRKPQGPSYLEGEHRSLADARRRRAAVEAQESSEEEGSPEAESSQASESSHDIDPAEISDDDAKNYLLDYQETKKLASMEGAHEDLEELGHYYRKYFKHESVSGNGEPLRAIAASARAVATTSWQEPSGWKSEVRRTATSFLSLPASSTATKVVAMSTNRAFVFGARDSSQDALEQQEGKGMREGGRTKAPASLRGAKRLREPLTEQQNVKKSSFLDHVSDGGSSKEAADHQNATAVVAQLLAKAKHRK